MKLILCGTKPFSRRSTLTVMAVLCLVVSVIYNPAFGTEPVKTYYAYVLKWGSKGSAIGQFNHPFGIAVDTSTHEIYVADTYNHRIQKFGLMNPCPTGTRQIVTGLCFVTKWGNQGSADGQFNRPRGIAVDSSTHEIYVADTENDRIQKFNSKGFFILKWGGMGSSIGKLYRPGDIAVDSFTHEVYVADTVNNRIQKFTSSGSPITSWGEIGLNPHGVAVDSSSQKVYVSEPTSSRIKSFTTNGTFIGQWGYSSMNNAEGTFLRPWYLTIDPSTHEIFVSDNSLNRIQVFTETGTFIVKWGNPTGRFSNRDGQFNGPMGIGIDPSTHHVYVADFANDRIQVFVLKSALH